MTTVQLTRYVDCPFSAIIEFAEDALRSRPDVTLSPMPPAGPSVQVDSQLTDDVSDTSRKHDALLLSWKPPVARIFPGFAGVLTARPQGRGAWIRIRGSYEPPLGAAGRAFDWAIGRFIARLTLKRFLRDIAASAERRWRAVRNEITA